MTFPKNKNRILTTRLWQVNNYLVRGKNFLACPACPEFIEGGLLVLSEVEKPKGLCLFWHHKHCHSFARQHCRPVNLCNIFEPGDYFVYQLLALFKVQHFASSEHHRNLNPMALFKKLAGVVQLYFAVVRVDFGPKTYLLDSYHMLLFDIVFFFSFLFVQIFAEVHNSAYRRPAVGRYLNKVKLYLSCLLQCFVNAYYADLLVLGVNQTNRAYSDLFINPEF